MTDEVVVWRRRALVAVAAAVLVLVALVVVWRSNAADPGVVASSEPSSTAATAEPTEPTEPSEPGDTAEPSEPSEPFESSEPSGPAGTPSERRRETVLFEGGPARGPWQQLGTVAEITHPGAPTSARYSWSNFWSDPEEENQPDELWDQLVIEVTDQLVELGDPVDRPAFGGAPGSEPFNSFGGLQDIYPDDEVYTASWSGTFSDEDGVAKVYYAFIVSFDGDILERADPLTFRESEHPEIAQVSSAADAWVVEWAASEGYTACLEC